MIFVLLFFATCFLAYSNGANDNFKGVASLFGSRTTGYRAAIGWATVTPRRLDLLDISRPDAAYKILRQRSGTRKTCRLAGFSPGRGSGRGYYCDRRYIGEISGFHYARIGGRDDRERPGF